MSNAVLNTLILSGFLAASVGGGYYVTQKQQPERLAQVEAEIEAIENRSAEVETLMAQQALASDEAALTLARWNSRYKVIPATLSSPDVVAYLDALSARGFQRFDYTLSGITPGTDASFYTYQITGEAYFESLFSFIWHVENGRGLYRIRDLSVKKKVAAIPNPRTGVDRQVVLAEFAMAVDAYFSGNPDLSPPDSAFQPPPEAFPSRRVAVNPFFPYVLETVPGNTDDLVDVEADELLAVTGGNAVFQRGEEMRTLRAGDRVYLGRIANVDPRVGRVTVDLNRGGIAERLTLDLETGERYRQHLGRATLAPTGRAARIERGPSLDDAPPAPGTPGADASGLYGEPSAAPPASARPSRLPPRPQPTAPYRPVPLGQ